MKIARSIIAAAAVATAVGFGPAMAADMPVKAAVTKAPVIAPLFDWSGWYVGVHAGYGWGDKFWTEPAIADPVADYRVDGFLGGVQLGFDRQFNNVLVGVQGDLSWSGIDGSGLGISDPDEGFATRVKRIATLTARLGYVANRSLLYVKGGAAWAWEQHEFFAVAGGPVTAVFNDRRSGWTAGAGLEHAIADQWSASIEYNYIDFGGESFVLGAQLPRVDQTVHTVKLGLNYRFATGKAPVMTKY